MAFGDAGTRIFGLREVKLVGVSASISLNAAQTMTFKERVKSGELSGNDKTLATAASSDAVEWELEEGGISLAAYALLTGRAAVLDAGVGDSTLTLAAAAQVEFPYFKIYGKSVGDVGDDVHVKVYKAKVLGGIEGQFADGEFFVSKCSGVAIDDGANGIYDIVHNETAAALPPILFPAGSWIGPGGPATYDGSLDS
jgi:hypothetical protein